MGARKIISFLKQHAVLMGISVCFLVSLSLVLHQITDHADMFMNIEGSAEKKAEWKTFLVTLYIMSASGFLMMVIVMGSLLNVSRLHDETKRINRILGKQMAAVEASTDGIAILDGNGTFSYMNKAHALCYGYDNADDLIGSHWSSLYEEKKRARFEFEVFPALRKQGGWSGTSYGRKKDGTEFPQEVTLSILDDGGLICVVRDISEKIKKENLLKLIKLAVEAADDAIAIADADNKMMFMNRSYLRIHGLDPYKRDEYIGKDWRSFYNRTGQDEVNALVLPTTILKGSWSGTVKVMRHDGVLFYADASLTRLPDGLMLGVMRDASERKKGEMEKEDLQEQLFQAQKMEAINRLSEGITSDFDSIISTIQQAAYIIEGDQAIPEESRILLREIVESSGQARDLVDQLLGFSHKNNVRAGVVDMSESILETVQAVQKDLPGNIECVVDIKVQDAYIYAVSEQLEQVLFNLCSNAVEALKGKRGKVAISLKEADRNPLGLQRLIAVDDVPDKSSAARVRIRQERHKIYVMAGYLLRGRHYLQVSVSDNGTGIPFDALPNIFDPFFTTKIGNSAAGLGLSLVHGTVISGNGAIVVETVAGEGTTVHLLFPRTNVLEYRNPETLLQAV